jgi:methylamine dehydrogenase heavy chain
MTPPFPRRRSLRLLATLLSGLVPVLALAQNSAVPSQLSKQATAELLDKPTIVKAPPSNSKRVYITDPGHFQVTTQVFTLDGDTGKLLGMSDAGNMAHVMTTHSGKFFATANSWWSRISRGKRTDYVQLIDAQTHDTVADIEISPTRFLSGVMPWMAAMTPDDHYLLFYQFSPSPGVGLVDLQKKSFVKMMDVPDCYEMFPTSSKTFYMNCRDGTLMKISYDEQGNTKREASRIFHQENEYLFNNPAYSMVSGRLVWPTYEGKIFQANLTDQSANFLPPIEAFTAAEKTANWRPGGWMPVAYHRPSDRIYLLADQRPQWHHKTTSRFVFVIDAKTGKRIARLDLGHETDSIGISQDAQPHLYALSTGEKTLYVHDATKGKLLHKVGELGRDPNIITTPEQ